MVAQTTLYPTTYKLISHKVPTLGIESTLVDQTNVEAFVEAIQPNTRLIYLESPANPVMSLTDIVAVAEIAKAQGITTVVDNTFASSFNQRPLSLGADLVLHSGTKYLGGPF